MKIEVSNGEIVDKLTILELKKENAQTQDQATHIEAVSYTHLRAHET